MISSAIARLMLLSIACIILFFILGQAAAFYGHTLLPSVH